MIPSILEYCESSNICIQNTESHLGVFQTPLIFTRILENFISIKGRFPVAYIKVCR